MVVVFARTAVGECARGGVGFSDGGWGVGSRQDSIGREWSGGAEGRKRRGKSSSSRYGVNGEADARMNHVSWLIVRTALADEQHRGAPHGPLPPKLGFVTAPQLIEVQ